MSTAPGYTPSWPTPSNVSSFITYRQGGSSHHPYHSNNLGTHVGDAPEAVASNRRHLRDHLSIPEPAWLNQIHGTDWINANDWTPTQIPNADASIATHPGRACVVLTADCLPLLLCDRFGHQVAAVHCGWRGLAQGIIHRILATFSADPGDLLAYLGPAISARHYEVGSDVRDALAATVSDHGFSRAIQEKPNHYLVDLYAVTRTQLSSLGLNNIHGGNRCTFAEPDHFYSYRRDGTTGRMATLIWLK